MTWLPISNSKCRASWRSRGTPLIARVAIAGFLLAVACGGSGKGATGQPAAEEPPSDPSAKITVDSASKPNRNQSPTEFGHDGTEKYLTAVNDCELPQCVGDPPAQLTAALREQASKARSCYEEALKSTPKIAGRLVVELRVTHEGRSCPVRVTTNELAESKTLVSCLRTLLERNYPAPSGGCSDLRLPLRFVPEYFEGDAGSAATAPRTQ